MPKQKETFDLTQKEIDHVAKNFRDKLPKEIADELGVSVRAVRDQVTLFEKNPPNLEEPPVDPLKDRPAVIKSMKGDKNGSLVMTPMASERGDEFTKNHSFIPDKFKGIVGKVYKS
jgi:hypothetical protein